MRKRSLVVTVAGWFTDGRGRQWVAVRGDGSVYGFFKTEACAREWLSKFGRAYEVYHIPIRRGLKILDLRVNKHS